MLVGHRVSCIWNEFHWRRKGFLGTQILLSLHDTHQTWFEVTEDVYIERQMQMVCKQGLAFQQHCGTGYQG